MITFQQISGTKTIKSVEGGGVATEKLLLLMAFLHQSDRLSSPEPISQPAPRDLEGGHDLNF